LQAAQRAYAEVYRDAPLTHAPTVVERIRASFAGQDR